MHESFEVRLANESDIKKKINTWQQQLLHKKKKY